MKKILCLLFALSGGPLAANELSLKTDLSKLEIEDRCLEYGRTYLSGDARRLNSSNFQHIVNCYFILNKGRAPKTKDSPEVIPFSSRYSVGFSKAILEKLYPDEIEKTDPEFVEESIVSLVEIMNKSEDFKFAGLLLIKKLADRYDMLLASKVEQDTHKALSEASEGAYLAAASSFVAGLFLNKWRKSGRLGYAISSLVTLGASAGVFKYQFDRKKGKFFVEGAPPGPVHILEQNSENLVSRLIRIEAKSGTTVTYEMSTMIGALALFPITRGLFNYMLYNPALNHLSKTRLKTWGAKAKKNICRSSFSWLAALNLTRPKTYWVLSKLGSIVAWFFHPSQLAGFLAAEYVASSGVNIGFKKAYLSDLSNAELKIQKALEEKNEVALEMAVRNYKFSVGAYADYLSIDFSNRYSQAIEEAGANIEEGLPGANQKIFHKISRSWFGTVLKKWVQQGTLHSSLVEDYINDYNLQTRESKIEEAFEKSEKLEYRNLKVPGLVYLKAAAFLAKHGVTRKINTWFLSKGDHEALKMGAILGMFEGNVK